MSVDRTVAVQQGTCQRCRGFMVPSFTDSLLLEMTDAPVCVTAPPLRR